MLGYNKKLSTADALPEVAVVGFVFHKDYTRKSFPCVCHPSLDIIGAYQYTQTVGNPLRYQRHTKKYGFYASDPKTPQAAPVLCTLSRVRKKLNGEKLFEN